MSTECIGNRYEFIWSGSTRKTRCGIARSHLRDSTRLDTPIEARCLVKVSVVGRGLSWSCSLWPRNTTPAIVSECSLRQRAPAEGERQRRKVDDGNCRGRLNWRRDTTDGTDLTSTEFLLGDTRMFIYYRTYNICRSCYAVSRRWRFDCWERKTFSARTWKIPRLGPRRANLIFASSTR